MARETCWDCSEPKIPNRSRCAKHLKDRRKSTLEYHHRNKERRNEERKERYRNRAESGVCVRCGGRLDEMNVIKGYKTCGSCHDDMAIVEMSRVRIRRKTIASYTV